MWACLESINLNQIKPDLVADFPKLAASAAHVMGRPLVWDEQGGGTGPDGSLSSIINSSAASIT